MSKNHDRHGQHMYGYTHKLERKRWAAVVRAVGSVCWRCGKLIPPGSRFDLGHVDEDGRARGFPARHPEHRACNRATVTHLKQKLQRRSSRDW